MASGEEDMEADSTTHPYGDVDKEEEFEDLMTYFSQLGRSQPATIRDQVKRRKLVDKLLFSSIGSMEEFDAHKDDMEVRRKMRRLDAILRSGISMTALFHPPAPRYSRKTEIIIPQTIPIDEEQIQNNAGGFVYAVDDMTRVRRMVCLGFVGGTYYSKEKDHSKENLAVIKRMIDEKKGEDIVKELLAFKGRIAKQNTLLLILATIARQTMDLVGKRAAYKALPKLCGTPSQLFQFLEFYASMKGDTNSSGWGRAHRIGIANWYLSYKGNPSKLAMQVTKYRQRNGWNHKDILRLCHVKPASERSSPALAVIFKFLTRGMERLKRGLDDDIPEELQKIVEYFEATEAVKKMGKDKIQNFVTLIEEYNLMREHLPTEVLNEIPIWRALLKKMPVFALIRNLGKMSTMGMLRDGSEESKLICEKLSNDEIIQASKIHPFNILQALVTYNNGHGDLGSLKWHVNQEVVNALDNAFHMAFKNIEPTNKRILLALDVSPSMSYQKIAGSVMSAHQAAAAMAMATVHTEKNHDIVGFAGQMAPLDIKPEDRLTKVMSTVSTATFDQTDCAQPMLWAYSKDKKYDAFVVYTDCETWSGHMHASEALRRYRMWSGILDAKLIVVAFTSTGFTIAKPDDRNMLDVAGFDSGAPAVISNFIMGNI